MANDVMDDLTCPWEILGVSPWDDATTIRDAWRALVRRYHPDLARTDRDAATRRLAEINHAFDVVSDPETARRKIDEMHRAEAAERAEAAQERPRRRASPEEDGHPKRAATSRERQRMAPASDWRAAQTAPERFDQALRILETGSGTPSRTIYL